MQRNSLRVYDILLINNNNLSFDPSHLSPSETSVSRDTERRMRARDVQNVLFVHDDFEDIC